MVSAPKLFAQQLVIVVMLIVVMLSCLGDLPSAAMGSPVPKHCSWSNPWLVNESRIESIFQSIVQSMVQSRVQSPAFALTRGPDPPLQDVQVWSSALEVSIT